MQLSLSTFASLRPWRPGDGPSLAHHANERAIWRNLRDAFPHPYTDEHAHHWVSQVVSETPATNLAIEVDGEAAGGIGLVVQDDIFRKTAEIGFWLGRRHWGRGIASAAVSAFSDYAFDTFDLVRLQAGVIHWNPASARVLEKAGYALEGRLRHAVFKDGEIADQLVFALVRAVWSAGRRR